MHNPHAKQPYADKKEFIAILRKSATLYIAEFYDISESDKDLRLEETERTPYENLVYQLGWMSCLQTWEREEQEGKLPQMPAPGIKWNKLGELHRRFNAEYENYTLKELTVMFQNKVDELCDWLDTFDETTLFNPGGRKWAQSSPSNWPVFKWVHINTVAPFKTFRAKIRKWKKLNSLT